jgi:hypothetical protein
MYAAFKTKEKRHLKVQILWDVISESVAAGVSKKNSAFIFRANQSIILLLNCMTSKWGTESLRNVGKYAVFIPEHMNLQQHDYENFCLALRTGF